MKKTDEAMETEFFDALLPALEGFWGDLKQWSKAHGGNLGPDDIGPGLYVALKAAWTAAIQEAMKRSDHYGHDCNCHDCIRRLPGGDYFGH